MNNPITTCRHKVDKKKFEEGWDRIWGKKSPEPRGKGVYAEDCDDITFEELQEVGRIMDEQDRKDGIFKK